MKGFSKKILSISCNEIGIDEAEYKDYITINNVEQIVKMHSKHDENDDFFVDKDIVDKISDELQNWVLGVQLSKMCSEGKLDCYWDDEADCMVFKVAEEKGDK